MPDARPASPRLIVFSDTSRAEPAFILERFAALATRAVPDSVLFVLRDYGLALRARWSFGQRLSELATRTHQHWGVADRLDLACALSCAAFHLPGNGFSARDARLLLGPNVWLSRGSHEACAAPEPELDALLLSPIFEPRKGRAALGVSALELAARGDGVRPALFALGGVSAHNAAQCLTAGAQGVAVIGAALAPDPDSLLAALGIAGR